MSNLKNILCAYSVALRQVNAKCLYIEEKMCNKKVYNKDLCKKHYNEEYKLVCEVAVKNTNVELIEMEYDGDIILMGRYDKLIYEETDKGFFPVGKYINDKIEFY